MPIKKQTLLISLSVLLLLVASFNIGVIAGQTSLSINQKITASTSAKDAFANLFLEKEPIIIPEDVDLDTFWRVWNIVNEKYVTSEMPSDQEKTWGAINGLVGSLNDPYSIFLPPQEAQMFKDDVSGSFEGVGMEVGLRENILTVISPLKNTPADRAGILAGDKVIQINGTSTYDLTLNEAVNLIRGPRGSTVTLSIVRESEDAPIEIKVVRDTIDIPVINTTLRDDGVFVIQLYSFYETSPQLFTKAIREFKASGSRKLVLDLRNNPGGFLEASVDIAGNFLPAGKVVVRESYGADRPETEHRTRDNFILKDYEYDMVVLMNQGSASASEILAGALSEYNIAPLIGEKSYGKGSVQELMEFEDGSSLKLTIARWLTPNGVSISEKGLTPDIEIKITAEDIKSGKDSQLDMAVQTLLKK